MKTTQAFALAAFAVTASSVAAAAAPAIYGGWELDRAASKLTMAPMDEETVVIVPWEKSGWIWNQLSGGPYQPEDLHHKVERIECGASHGATAIPCKGSEPHMMLYWATFDGKQFPTYGTKKVQVQLKQVDDHSFTETLSDKGAADTAGIVFSADGKHMTVTTKSGSGGADDVRVYKWIDGATWPTVKP